MFDVSVTPASEIIAAAFKWSHLVFASTTYNAGIFVSMEALINDLVSHNIQNRTVAIIENGSWAATSGGLIRDKLEKCKNIKILEQKVSIKSAIKETQLSEIEAMASVIASDITNTGAGTGADSGTSATTANTGNIDPGAMFKLSYGLFVLTAKDGSKDNGCIINTAIQITSSPLRLSIALSKSNFTHDMIAKTGEFNVSILDTSAPFGIFQQFGFQSGKDTDKFADVLYDNRTENGIRYLPEHTNCVISTKVIDSYDYGTHTLFIADITEAIVLSKEPSVTYRYYFDHIKPKPNPPAEVKNGFVCKICAYVFEGDVLPDDFICPLCKHGASDFEPL